MAPPTPSPPRAVAVIAALRSPVDQTEVRECHVALVHDQDAAGAVGVEGDPAGGAGDRGRGRVGEGQLSAVDRYGAGDLEVDGVGAGVGVRLADGVAERAGAAVVEQAGDV